MLTEIEAPNIHLRPAAPEDCELVFGWRNIPEIVQLSFTRRQVSIAEHTKWYEDVLASTHKLAFIVEESGFPVGMVRFDINKFYEAEISIYLIPEKTGLGLGTSAIARGCDLLFASINVNKVIAKTRKDNERSAKAFAKCGFRLLHGSIDAEDYVFLVKTFGCASNE